MMLRRHFITLLGSAAAWPLAAHGQQAAMPVVGFVNGASAIAAARDLAGFRKGLSDAGYVEGQNVTVEYHWLEGRTDRVPEVVADLARRHVAVIAAPAGLNVALAAKAAKVTVPIVFGVGEDPVRLGLVDSLARPGGSMTGINFFVREVITKRLQLLHELVPNAIRIAVLIDNPGIAANESALREVEEAAPAIGLQIQILNATTVGEIDEVFDNFARKRPDAVFVWPNAFFTSRRGQFATLSARERIPATYSQSEFVEAGGLMSYGPDIADMFRQVGVYTASILKGMKPADLPITQAVKLQFAINLQTARALGLTVPPSLLALADEVIE
jgi:putative ABC transport system substrate-binding protein